MIIRAYNNAKSQVPYLFYVGLFFGVLYSVGGFFIDLIVTIGWIETNETPGLSIGTLYAFGALVGMPVIAIVLGFIALFFGYILFEVFHRKS